MVVEWSNHFTRPDCAPLSLQYNARRSQQHLEPSLLRPQKSRLVNNVTYTHNLHNCFAYPIRNQHLLARVSLTPERRQEKVTYRVPGMSHGNRQSRAVRRYTRGAPF